MQMSARPARTAPPTAAELAELGALRGEVAPAAAPAAAPPPPAEKAAADPAPAAPPAPDEPAEDPISDTPDGEEPAAEVSPTSDAAPAKPPEPKPDPAEERGMASVRRMEEQARKRLTAERAAMKAEIDKAKAEWAEERARAEKQLAPMMEQVKAFEALKARARYAPDAVLEHLGLTAADFEPAARALWSRTEAASADPKNREAVARMMRERETDDRVAAIIKKNEELEKRLAEQNDRWTAREQEAESARQANEYLDAVTGAVSDSAPLVQRWMAKDKAKVREQFAVVAMELAQETGEAPNHADVVQEVERRRRADLEVLGFDPDAILATPKKAAPAAPAAPPAKTLRQAGGAPTPPKKRQTDDELRAEFEQLRRSGQIAE